MLSVIIKNSVFFKKRQGGSTHRSGGDGESGGGGRQETAEESYAGVLSRPSQRERRGGYRQRGRSRGRRS